MTEIIFKSLQEICKCKLKTLKQGNLDKETSNSIMAKLFFKKVDCINSYKCFNDMHYRNDIRIRAPWEIGDILNNFSYVLIPVCDHFSNELGLPESIFLEKFFDPNNKEKFIIGDVFFEMKKCDHD